MYGRKLISYKLEFILRVFHDIGSSARYLHDQAGEGGGGVVINTNKRHEGDIPKKLYFLIERYNEDKILIHSWEGKLIYSIAPPLLIDVYYCCRSHFNK